MRKNWDWLFPLIYSLKSNQDKDQAADILENYAARKNKKQVKIKDSDDSEDSDDDKEEKPAEEKVEKLFPPAGHELVEVGNFCVKKFVEIFGVQNPKNTLKSLTSQQKILENILALACSPSNSTENTIANLAKASKNFLAMLLNQSDETDVFKPLQEPMQLIFAELSEWFWKGKISTEGHSILVANTLTLTEKFIAINDQHPPIKNAKEFFFEWGIWKKFLISDVFKTAIPILVEWLDTGILTEENKPHIHQALLSLSQVFFDLTYNKPGMQDNDQKKPQELQDSKEWSASIEVLIDCIEKGHISDIEKNKIQHLIPFLSTLKKNPRIQLQVKPYTAMKKRTIFIF